MREKRDMPRFSALGKVTLQWGEKTVPARLVNYSAKGFGVCCDQKVPDERMVMVHVDDGESGHFSCRVTFNKRNNTTSGASGGAKYRLGLSVIAPITSGASSHPPQKSESDAKFEHSLTHLDKG